MRLYRDIFIFVVGLGIGFIFLLGINAAVDLWAVAMWELFHAR